MLHRTLAWMMGEPSSYGQCTARRQPGTGIERLRSFLRRYAEINMGDFGRCVIRTGEEALSEESRQRFRALKKQIDRAMRKLIEEGIADGSVAPVDPKLLAFTLAGALNWPARWYDVTGTQNAEDLAREMVDVLTNGFAPRTATGASETNLAAK